MNSVSTPEDFTWNKYRDYLATAKQIYTIVDFFNFKNVKRALIWRHDVDFSPMNAFKMANIDYEQNVSSTFYICLRSTYYNFLDEKNLKIFRSILDMNHNIGLHFDHRFYTMSKSEFETGLNKEKRIIEEELKIKVKSFSFHMNDDVTAKFKADSYSGLLNVNSSSIEDQFKYCSDSNGYWRYQSIDEILKNKTIEKLQILTHPVWWSDTEMSLKERLKLCLKEQYKNNYDWYSNVIKENGRLFN